MDDGGLLLKNCGILLNEGGCRRSRLLLGNDDVNRSSVDLGTHGTNLTVVVQNELLPGVRRDESFLLVRTLGSYDHTLGSCYDTSAWTSDILNLNKCCGIRCHYQSSR